MKKIAILLPRFAGGGAERVSLELARSLREFGYTAELWATRFDPDRRAEIENEGIVTASPRDFAGKVRHRSKKAAYAVARMVEERGIDVLVIAVSPLGDMAGLRARIGCRCRIVFHLHGQPFWELVPFNVAKPAPRGFVEVAGRCLTFLKKDLKEKLFSTYTRRADRLYRSTYEACDAYVVLCEAYKADLERRLGIRTEDSKVHAIYNPVAGLDKLKSVSAGPKRREVLFVGRLTYSDKRVDRLLRIWQKAGRADWTLRIVGDGPEKKNLEKLSAELGLENVIFEGYANPEPFYAGASIVALTSTFEGWPGSLLEALAAACRPIAFACSDGVAEILDGGRGESVPPFDEEEYAGRLSALMDAFPLKHRPETSQWLERFTDRNVASSWHRLFSAIIADEEI